MDCIFVSYWVVYAKKCIMTYLPNQLKKKKGEEKGRPIESHTRFLTIEFRNLLVVF